LAEDLDRSRGRDWAHTVPGHELSGVVVELGYGTTGLTVCQRVFGLTDWTRNGSLAEYAAVEARNLDGRLKPIVAAVRPLAEAPAAFAPDQRTPGKTIIRITEGG
jgi:NADPH:quinone reductase-like Zn-dependent oxidoreductase